MDRPLLSLEELARSPVAANSAMNRERGLMGPNSYTRELGFNPLELLKGRLPRVMPRQPDGSDTALPSARWLDLCCGSGRALLEADRRLRDGGLGGQVQLLGVDLMPMFLPVPVESTGVRFVAASLAEWEPDTGERGERAGTQAPGRREADSLVQAPGFDLITCVHGLHYVGDKLNLIRRILSWLASEGLFVGHLDLRNIRREDGSPPEREIRRLFRTTGVTYDARRHLLRCEGRRAMEQPYPYLGADDHAGPNYTGQDAVNSYYDFGSAGAETRGGTGAGKTV